MTQPVARPRLILLLLLIMGIASSLRIVGLTAESLWLDEVLTTYSAREPLTRVIDSVRAHENAPPAYFVVMNLWVKCFGMSDRSLRLPSALMGIATVALLWRLGSEWFDQAIGLTAAALLAVSPIHIAYSQEARMYAMLVLLLTANLWAVVRTMRNGSAAAQIANVVTAALALLTHTFAAFTLAAVNLFWLWRLRRREQAGVTWRRWLTLNGAVLVLFAPWVPATIEVARMGLPWLIKSTSFTDATIGYAGGTIPAIAMAGICLVAIVAGWRRRDDRILLLVLLALAPVLGPIALKTFTTRYGIAAPIGLTMLAAYGAASNGKPACVAVVLLAMLVWVTNSTLGHARYRNYTPKIDVRSAVEFVRTRMGDGDAVVAGSRDIWHVGEYYSQPKGLKILIDADALAPNRPGRVWVIAPSGPDLPIAGYDVSSRTSLDRINVLELHRATEPATTPSVPSTYPRN